MIPFGVTAATILSGLSSHSKWKINLINLSEWQRGKRENLAWKGQFELHSTPRNWRLVCQANFTSLPSFPLWLSLYVCCSHFLLLSFEAWLAEWQNNYLYGIDSAKQALRQARQISTRQNGPTLTTPKKGGRGPSESINVRLRDEINQYRIRLDKSKTLY